MTSYTTVLDLPYPDDADDVTEGDDAIQALATELDTRLDSRSALVVIGRANSGAALGSTLVVVPMSGPALGLVGFTYADGVLTYTGAHNRMFMVDAEVEVQNGAGGGTSSIQSTCYLFVNGSAEIAGSNDRVQATAATLSVRNVTHRITTPVELAPGNTLHVSANCSPGGTLGIVGIRVYPIGPGLS